MKTFLQRIICNPSTSALGFLALILTCVVWMVPGLPTEAQATVSAVLVLFARKCLLSDDPKPPAPPALVGLLLVSLAACQSNRPVLNAIGDLRRAVVKLDSSYNAFNLNYSNHVKAQIDSTVHRYSDPELERQIKRLTDPKAKY